jgi:hypothetical protein
MIEQLPFLVTAFANHMRETSQKGAASDADTQATRLHRDIGPIGTAARLVLGLLLGGLIVYGQLSSSGHLAPTTWTLGLIGFPALVLAWHFWRIRRNPARFSDTSALSFVLSLALPVALYLTGWFVPPLWFTSDATLIFVGSSLLLAALRGDAGCEFLALSNWLLRRSDQMACAVFTPIDSLDQRGSRS